MSKLTAAIALVVFSCSTVPTGTSERDVPAMSSRMLPAQVAIVAAATPPEVKPPPLMDRTLDPVAGAAGEAAAAAGIVLAGQCVATVLICVVLGPLCVPVIGSACAAGAGLLAGGMVVGAAALSDEETAADKRADEDVVTDPGRMNATLRDLVIAAASANGQPSAPEPASRSEASGAVDSSGKAEPAATARLEVAVIKAGAYPTLSRSRMHFVVDARARLIRTVDNAEIASSDYRYVGYVGLPQNRRRQWVQNLANAYAWLGSAIFDDVFLLYPFPDRKPYRLSRMVSAFGLAPDETLFWSNTSTLQPMLKWQRFPRDADVQTAPDAMSRVRDVRYDLLVAKAENGAPVEIVYRRDRLAQAEHAIDIPLSPNVSYLWTVRASFEIDGQHRVTEWASTTCCRSFKSPAMSYDTYSFKTP